MMKWLPQHHHDNNYDEAASTMTLMWPQCQHHDINDNKVATAPPSP